MHFTLTSVIITIKILMIILKHKLVMPSFMEKCCLLISKLKRYSWWSSN